SDNMAISAVQDALGLGAAKIDTAYAGMESAIDVVKEIKAKIVAATEQRVDKGKVQEEIQRLQAQLVAIAQSASFNGQNWLLFHSSAATAADPADKTIVSGFVRSNDGTVKTTSTTYTLESDSTTGMNVLFGSIGTTGAGVAGILGSTAGALGLDGTFSISATVESLDITDYTDGDMAEALSLVEGALQLMTSA